ncbi:MAG: AAA family ATPase [Elainellaceae cyanobacterium]
MFDIRDYVTFDQKGRAECPACSQQGKGKKKNLALVPDSSNNYTGAYKCHRGCAPQDIRSALGNPKPQQQPSAMVKATPKPVTISPAKVKEQSDRLLNSDGPAMTWLTHRGITREMAEHYKLGISRCKVGNRQKWAIAIPIPNDDHTAYYCKKRVCPWDATSQELAEYQPWKQYGIPQMVFITHKPESATETWLCEGEWDAIMLGWMLREQKEIAVACFTCGAGNVPPDDELEKLPGQITIFYDRNDKPLKNGDRPGEVGATRAAERMGERAKISLVPMPNGCKTSGWDVSDAIQNGFDQAAFMEAAAVATKPKSKNPVRSRLLTNDELMAIAPEYVEWLVPDLLTHNELFAVAAPPRGGKSLLAMTLAKCVALGENFLDRPVTQGAVLYVNLEDSSAKIREREESQGWPTGLPIYWLDKFKLSEIDHLTEVIEEIDPRLVVLDTLSRVRNDGVAEASAEMSIVLEPLQETAKKHNCCILLIHHTKKIDVNAGDAIDIFDSIRGSGAIRATCRGCIIIAPADNSYRLVAENGHGKHDLKVRLDVNSLEWKLMGRWSPSVNLDQRQQAIDYLNKVGSATIDQIATETQLPKRSLYTVLARLVGDDIVEKTGTRQSAIYSRPIQQIQQLNSVLNSPKPDGDLNSGAIQQKNTFSSLDSGHLSSDERMDHPPLNDSKPNQDKELNAVDPQDHPPHTTQPVELTPGEGSNSDTVNDSAIQQQFNSNSTVELVDKKPDKTSLSGGGDLGVIQTGTRVIRVGDFVEILTGRFAGSLCAVVGTGPDNQLEVRRDSWAITRLFDPAALKLIPPSFSPGDVVKKDGIEAVVERDGQVYVIVSPYSGAETVGWRKDCVEVVSRIGGEAHAHG